VRREVIQAGDPTLRIPIEHAVGIQGWIGRARTELAWPGYLQIAPSQARTAAACGGGLNLQYFRRRRSAICRTREHTGCRAVETGIENDRTARHPGQELKIAERRRIVLLDRLRHNRWRRIICALEQQQLCIPAGLRLRRAESLPSRGRICGKAAR